MEEDELKDEVVLFSDVIEWIRVDNKRMRKVLLKCLNCRHMDVLGNMIMEKSSYIAYKSKSVIFFEQTMYDVIFHCPKCGSGAIALDESEIPKIVADKLSQ